MKGASVEGVSCQRCCRSAAVEAASVWIGLLGYIVRLEGLDCGHFCCRSGIIFIDLQGGELPRPTPKDDPTLSTTGVFPGCIGDRFGALRLCLCREVDRGASATTPAHNSQQTDLSLCVRDAHARIRMTNQPSDERRLFRGESPVFRQRFFRSLPHVNLTVGAISGGLKGRPLHRRVRQLLTTATTALEYFSAISTLLIGIGMMNTSRRIEG